MPDDFDPPAEFPSRGIYNRTVKGLIIIGLVLGIACLGLLGYRLYLGTVKEHVEIEAKRWELYWKGQDFRMRHPEREPLDPPEK